VQRYHKMICHPETIAKTTLPRIIDSQTPKLLLSKLIHKQIAFTVVRPSTPPFSEYLS